MRLRVFIIFLFVFFICGSPKSKSFQTIKEDEPELRFMFYNVENLFDTFDDSLTLDNDFLPEGNYHWTINRFNDKLKRIYKVIAATGGWEPPDIIGLCEIENRYVLEQLTQNTPLMKHNYQIVHKNSPDRRGIDVGLIYNPKKVEPVKEEFIKVFDPGDANFKTRDILYFSCKAQKDTLHFFINHWPSRWGGQYQSESKRVMAAKTLRLKIDSLFHINPRSKIIISGDFNDTPNDKSLSQHLMALNGWDSISLSALYNLSNSYCDNYSGTHKYREEWACLDQVIVSGSLLDKKGIYTSVDKAQVSSLTFLFEDDSKYHGKKPFRTYVGMKYNGGFSDHLPVFIDFYSK